MEPLLDLGLALVLGLLVGTERGWQERSAQEGTRIAGIRTFGLIGLLGGLWALLSRELGDVLLGLAFIAFAALMIFAYVLDTRIERSRSITTVVAALVTFALGALAVRGYEAVAAAGAVVTAVLLSLKPVLHRWLQRLEAVEIFAALKLLLISVVLLPVLPDKGFGPWKALNPYEIWWLVVLIAGISFAGYVAMRLAGTRRGILLTGLFGGLVSSTAVAINLSRLGKSRRPLTSILAAGILAAAATMFPRMLLAVTVVNRDLTLPLVVPLGVMTIVVAVGAFWYWRPRNAPVEEEAKFPMRNPFELMPALKFGILLAVIMLMAQMFQRLWGAGGVYLLSGFSGLADVDAITLSLARLARQGLAPDVAVRGIVLAAMVNTVVKGGLAFGIAGRALGLRVIVILVAAALLGGASLFLVAAIAGV
jgi:uncharacterized membrane protein (DUF4010 family)